MSVVNDGNNGIKTAETQPDIKQKVLSSTTNTIPKHRLKYYPPMRFCLATKPIAMRKENLFICYCSLKEKTLSLPSLFNNY